MNGDGTRFDHVTVNGTLARAADDVLLDFTDLQLTRGARLERAPALHARLELEPDLKIARTTVRAERIPFMAAEFVAGLLAPQTRAGVSRGARWLGADGRRAARRALRLGRAPDFSGILAAIGAGLAPGTDSPRR